MKGTKNVSRLNTGLRKSSILERVFAPSKYFLRIHIVLEEGLASLRKTTGHHSCWIIADPSDNWCPCALQTSLCSTSFIAAHKLS